MYKHFYIGLIFIDLQLGCFKPLLLAMPLTIKLSNSAFEFCAKANEVLNNKRIK
jgi:hypothetical protein